MGKFFWELDILISGFGGALAAILMDDSRLELLFHAAIFAVGFFALFFVWDSYRSDDDEN